MACSYSINARLRAKTALPTHGCAVDGLDVAADNGWVNWPAHTTPFLILCSLCSDNHLQLRISDRGIIVIARRSIPIRNGSAALEYHPALTIMKGRNNRSRLGEEFRQGLSIAVSAASGMME